jgi:integrase
MSVCGDLSGGWAVPGDHKDLLSWGAPRQIIRGFTEPRQSGTMARLKLVQAGVARDRVHRGVALADKRLPITVPILRGLISIWALTHSKLDSAAQAERYDCVLLQAAAALCFFGFFRAGELTVPMPTAFDERVHLAWGDVDADNANPPSSVRVHLKRSKCDQLGNGVDVYVGRTGTDVCPVALTLRYVTERGPSPGPFFKRFDGSPLTKAFFVVRVRRALQEQSIDPQRYAGHSFRIGAATAAAQAGLEDSVIQALGRWSSAAFLRYIRTSRESLAAFSRQLGATGNT